MTCPNCSNHKNFKVKDHNKTNKGWRTKIECSSCRFEFNYPFDTGQIKLFNV